MRVGLFEILPAMIPGTRHATNARKVRPAHRIVKLFFPENPHSRNTQRERQLRHEHSRQIRPNASSFGHITRFSAVFGKSDRPWLMRSECTPNISNDYDHVALLRSSSDTLKQQEITDRCLNPAFDDRIIRPQFRPGRDRPFAESSRCRFAEANRS